MSNPIPRIYFGLPLVVLGLAAGLSGCGSSHHHHGSYNDTDGYLDLGKLSSSEVATIALGYYPGSTSSDNSVIELSCKGGQAVSRTMTPQKVQRERIERFGTAEMEEAGRAAVAQYKQECLAKGLDMTASRTVNTVYTDLAEGETTDVNVYLRSKKNVTVQKMHANADTKSTIVFAQVVNGSPVISKEEALSFDQYFGVNNPYDSEGMGIGERVRKTFGSEWRKNGGMDGTEKVILVFLDSSTIGSGTYGYSTTIDSLPKSSNGYSNEGEILYLNAAKKGIDIYSTMAHEFQHMCNFNQKYIKDGAFSGTSYELLSLNEGQSMLAEDVCGFNLAPVNGDTAEPGNYFLGSAINGYLANSAQIDSLSFDNSYGAYGKAYLTLRYIADRFGINYVTKMCTSNGVGFDNIKNVTGTEMSDIMDGMTVASTALEGLPSKMRFENLILDANYELSISEDTSETVYVSSIQGDEVQASNFSSGSVELKPNTSAVIDILGDGSRIKLNYYLPGDCTGTVIVSNNGTYVEAYDM
ncbi:MAG: hypothetical protein Q4F00_04665 [bacterium]|nr:hypothetical protein [bacterium]